MQTLEMILAYVIVILFILSPILIPTILIIGVIKFIKFIRSRKSPAEAILLTVIFIISPAAFLIGVAKGIIIVCFKAVWQTLNEKLVFPVLDVLLRNWLQYDVIHLISLFVSGMLIMVGYGALAIWLVTKF